jgi:hypothetical protein
MTHALAGRLVCPACTARLLMVLDVVTAVVTIGGMARPVRTWFHCIGCHSSFGISVR